MSEFKKPIHEIDTTRATAHLPNVDIEIVHRRAPDSDCEQILISMQAVPSFDAFGRFLRGANPFSFWAEFNSACLAVLGGRRPPRDAPTESSHIAAATQPKEAVAFLGRTLNLKHLERISRCLCARASD